METIYKRQKGLTTEKEQILSFLGQDEDIEVLNELENRKLSNQEKQMLEGEISKKEMREQLFNHMKPNIFFCVKFYLHLLYNWWYCSIQPFLTIHILSEEKKTCCHDKRLLFC